MSDTSIQQHDHFLIRQKIKPMVNVYEVRAGSDPKSLGPLVAFVRQKRLAFKEQIRVFADETQNQALFEIKARRVIEIGGNYDVVAADGTAIGTLEKRFKKSLIRSTWGVLDPQGTELMLAQEKSAAVAVMRRVKEVVSIADLIPLPYHFTFLKGEREVGGLRRVMSLRDQYVLDVSGDAERSIDRRLAISLAIALDALQGR